MSMSADGRCSPTAREPKRCTLVPGIPVVTISRIAFRRPRCECEAAEAREWVSTADEFDGELLIKRTGSGEQHAWKDESRPIAEIHAVVRGAIAM